MYVRMLLTARIVFRLWVSFRPTHVRIFDGVSCEAGCFGRLLFSPKSFFFGRILMESRLCLFFFLVRCNAGEGGEKDVDTSGYKMKVRRPRREMGTR